MDDETSELDGLDYLEAEWTAFKAMEEDGIPAALAAFLVVPSAMAQAPKTAAVCNSEYKAQKPALKAAKEIKTDFISACRSLPVGTPTPAGASTSPALKTTAACDAEYKTDKAALKAAMRRGAPWAVVSSGETIRK